MSRVRWVLLFSDDDLNAKKSLSDEHNLEKVAKDDNKQEDESIQNILGNEKSANADSHKCGKCKRLFNFKDSLIKHVKNICSKSKRELSLQYCGKCKRQFNFKYSLKRHMEKNFCSESKTESGAVVLLMSHCD